MAAAVDELFLAPDELHHARLALAREIAGREPACLDRLEGRLIQVAAHEKRARDLQLAHLARRHRLSALADDAIAHARRGPADAAGIALRVGGHEEEIAGRRLGEAVDVD